MRKIRRILIYRVGNLGDTVCAIPAMVALRRKFPNVWIGLLTNKEKMGNPDPEEILKGNDFLDDIVTYDAKRMGEVKYLWEFLKKLHFLRVDLLVYLSLSKSTRKRLLRDWLFFRLASCGKLIGFKMPRPIKTALTNNMQTPIFAQEVDRLMSLLTPLGIDPTIIEFRLSINKKHKKSVDAIWRQYDLRDEDLIIAFCPGAKFSSKRWEAKRFAQVASILRENFGAKILLIGGPSEITSGEEIVKRVGNSIVNLIGKTNYMESAEVISRCNLLVANDCGPVHLASAVKTPVVGVYSSRDYPGAWHPWGENHTVLRNDVLPCRFCLKTECETMRCINSITVDQVVNACCNYLRINIIPVESNE